MSMHELLPANKSNSDLIISAWVAEHFVEWMHAMSRVPKPTLSFNFGHNSELERVSKASRVTVSELLAAWTHVVGSLPIAARWETDDVIAERAEICNSHSGTLAINLDPWMQSGSATPLTVDVQQELDLFDEKFANINRIIGSTPTALVINSEKWQVKAGDDAWNDALTARNDDIYHLCRRHFPTSPLDRYSEGGVFYNSGGMQYHANYTGQEISEGSGAVLYSIGDTLLTVETWKRTCDKATADGKSTVNPWVAVGYGYKPVLGSVQITEDWNYDLLHSWEAGRLTQMDWFGNTPENREKYGDWRMRRRVVLYQLFSQLTPNWLPHIVAYLRGAIGEPTPLPESV